MRIGAGFAASPAIEQEAAASEMENHEPDRKRPRLVESGTEVNHGALVGSKCAAEVPTVAASTRTPAQTAAQPSQCHHELQRQLPTHVKEAPAGTVVFPEGSPHEGHGVPNNTHTHAGHTQPGDPTGPVPLVRQSCGEDDKKVVMRITPNSEQLDMSPGNPPRGDKLQAPGYADVDAGPPDNHAVREVQQTGVGSSSGQKQYPIEGTKAANDHGSRQAGTEPPSALNEQQLLGSDPVPMPKRCSAEASYCAHKKAATVPGTQPGRDASLAGACHLGAPSSPGPEPSYPNGNRIHHGEVALHHALPDQPHQHRSSQAPTECLNPTPGHNITPDTAVDAVIKIGLSSDDPTANLEGPNPIQNRPGPILPVQPLPAGNAAQLHNKHFNLQNSSDNPKEVQAATDKLQQNPTAKLAEGGIPNRTQQQQQQQQQPGIYPAVASAAGNASTQHMTAAGAHQQHQEQNDIHTWNAQAGAGQQHNTLQGAAASQLYSPPSPAPGTAPAQYNPGSTQYEPRSSCWPGVYSPCDDGYRPRIVFGSPSKAPCNGYSPNSHGSGSPAGEPIKPYSPTSPNYKPDSPTRVYDNPSSKRYSPCSGYQNTGNMPYSPNSQAPTEQRHQQQQPAHGFAGGGQHVAAAGNLAQLQSPVAGAAAAATSQLEPPSSYRGYSVHLTEKFDKRMLAAGCVEVTVQRKLAEGAFGSVQVGYAVLSGPMASSTRGPCDSAAALVASNNSLQAVGNPAGFSIGSTAPQQQQHTSTPTEVMSVAIKVFRSADEAYTRDFEGLKRALGQKYCLQLYAVGYLTAPDPDQEQHGQVGFPCLVLQLVERTLADVAGPCTEGQVQKWSRQLLEALTALRGVVHRDIKPDNLLLDDNDNLLLADYGCCKIYTPSPSTDSKSDYGPMMNTFTGTELYMAPEVGNSGFSGYDRTVDSFSVGVVALALMMGGSHQLKQRAKQLAPDATLSHRALSIIGFLTEVFFMHEHPRLQLSNSFRDFLSRCCDSRCRELPEQLLEHSWITGVTPDGEVES